jgi:hypothetical protein
MEKRDRDNQPDIQLLFDRWPGLANIAVFVIERNKRIAAIERYIDSVETIGPEEISMANECDWYKNEIQGVWMAVDQLIGEDAADKLAILAHLEASVSHTVE